MAKFKIPKGYRVEDGYQDQCDRCFRWVPRAKLLWQLQRYVVPAGTNRIPYSSYSSSWWSSTAEDRGMLSIGRSDYYATVDLSGTLTHHGIQTWRGDGVISGGALDCSSYTRLLLLAYFGRYQAAEYASFSVTLGLKNGATEYDSGKSAVVRGSKQVWGVVEMADVAAGHLAALTPYFSVTTSGGSEDDWWVDHFQAVEDLSSPGAMLMFLPTSGSAVARSSDQTEVSALKVCERCRRRTPLDIVNDVELEVPDPPEMAEDLEVD